MVYSRKAILNSIYSIYLNMSYKCNQCGHSSEQAGNCPTCNVAMEEVKEGGASETPAAPETSEASGSESEQPAG